MGSLLEWEQCSYMEKPQRALNALCHVRIQAKDSHLQPESWLPRTLPHWHPALRLPTARTVTNIYCLKAAQPKVLWHSSPNQPREQSKKDYCQEFLITDFSLRGREGRRKSSPYLYKPLYLDILLLTANGHK